MSQSSDHITKRVNKKTNMIKKKKLDHNNLE